MAGRMIRAIGRTRFNYTTAQLPASQFVEAMVVPRIDVTGFKTVELILRFHSGTTLASTQKVEVLAVADAFTEEDPAIFFRTLSSAPNGTATLSASTGFPAGAAPQVAFANVSAPFGGMITLIVKISQGSAASTIDATISCDVNMKDC